MTVQAGCKIKNLPTRFINKIKKEFSLKKNKKEIRIQYKLLTEKKKTNLKNQSHKLTETYSFIIF